jgi:SAM-dependent methyltransferase
LPPYVRRLKTLLPGAISQTLRAAYYPCFRALLSVRCWYADVRHPHLPIPPALLRYRVSESTDAGLFLSVGEQTSQNIQAALLGVDRRVADFHSILDFGCGCGRTLLWLMRQFPGARFCGADVDAEAIAWCRAHLPDADWRVNEALPPLDFPDQEFDLIYTVSVFTHLPTDLQQRWLPELARILRPGGILLLTVHGERAWSQLDSAAAQRLRREGFLFQTSAKLRGILPDWYHTAFHTQEYAVAQVGAHLSVLAYVAGGMGDQDVIIARR